MDDPHAQQGPSFRGMRLGRRTGNPCEIAWETMGIYLLVLNVSREWMGMGAAGIIIDSLPVDHSLIPY